MNQLFFGASAFNQDLSLWDTSNVSNMSLLFFGASAFNSDISPWNTAQVTSMTSMFTNASAFDHSLANLDISGLAAPQMGGMLNGSGLSNAHYAATLEGWAAQPIADGLTLQATGKIANTCARVYLVETKGWTITDGSEASPFTAIKASCSTGSISWAPTPLVQNGSPFTPSPTPVTNGGAVGYSVDSANSTSNCVVNRNSGSISFTTEGTCRVVATSSPTATAFSGSTNVTFTVALLPLAVITWNPVTTIVSSPSPFVPSPSPTTTGGAFTYAVVNPVTGGCGVNLTTGAITFMAAGTCTIRLTTEATGSAATAFLDVVFTLPTPSTTPTSGTSNSGNSSPVVQGLSAGLNPALGSPGATAFQKSPWFTRNQILTQAPPSPQLFGLDPVDSQITARIGLLLTPSIITPAHSGLISLSDVSRRMVTAPVVAHSSTSTLTFSTPVALGGVAQSDVRLITAGTLLMVVYPVDDRGNVLHQPQPQEFWVVPGGVLRIMVTGLQPNSAIRAWLYSTPREIGAFDLNSSGEVVAEFVIPGDLEAGDHTLKIVGPTPEGEVLTLALALRVAPTEVLTPATEASVAEESETTEPQNSLVWAWISLVVLLALIILFLLWLFRNQKAKHHQ
jgi:surface protein